MPNSSTISRNNLQDRSTPAIFSQVIATFRQRGGDWTPQRELAWQGALRAATRGLGPARHPTPFPPLWLPGLTPADNPWVPQGPAGPRDCLVVGCWWSLWAVDLEKLRLQGVAAHGANVTLFKRVSKTDTEAAGTSRTHACICGNLQGAPTLTTTAMCTARVVLRQAQRVRGLPGVSGATSLCPTIHGGVVAKADMVSVCRRFPRAAPLLEGGGRGSLSAVGASIFCAGPT